MRRTLLLILFVVGCVIPRDAAGNELILTLNEQIFVRNIKCDPFQKKYEISFNDEKRTLRLKVKLKDARWPWLEQQCLVRDSLINKPIPEYHLNLVQEGTLASWKVQSHDSSTVEFIGPDNIRVIVEVVGPSKVTDISRVNIGKTVSSLRLLYAAGALLGQAR